ncbi:ferric/cupric reductase transmembrane component 1 [[Candida] anglica]|uniref:ferric-chelate reductase (NADPH) n=1 Tax=[Candida] anglica TaxID=148631 RepID=A0ABP0E7W2_9ASCO
MKYNHLSVLCFIISVVVAAGPTITHQSETAYETCEELISSSFPGTLGNYCLESNQPALGSMALCIVQSFNKTGVTKRFLKHCKISRASFDSAYLNATKFVTDTPKLGYPVSVSKEEVLKEFTSALVSDNNKNWHLWYGIAVIGYWIVIMLISSIFHWSYFLFPSVVRGLHGPISNKFRSYLTIPAVGKKHHTHHKSFLRYLHCSVPTRFESVVILGWFILIAAFHLSNIYFMEGKPRGINIGDRSANLLVYSLSLLIIFPGRNNFLQWITGWSYSRFLAFHKWIARIVFLLVLIHAGCETQSLVSINTYTEALKVPHIRAGVAGVVSISLLVGSSFSFLRRSYYELFVLTHILLAIAFIASGWIHAKGFGFENFFLAATVIWGFDRILRLSRIFAFGIQPAIIRVIADETLKVTVTRPKYWKPFPGCHAYIYFLQGTCFWQSHPFTIVDSISEDNTITFYIKIKGGITHSLFRKVSRSLTNSTEMKVLVEGPYNHILPLHIFESVVFLTGGNGIPGLYAQALDLAKIANQQQTIKLYWIIRNYKSIEWFYPELLKLKSTSVNVTIFVTQPSIRLNGHMDEDDKCDENFKSHSEYDDYADHKICKYILKLKERLSFITFEEGRPNIPMLMANEISESRGSIAFNSCAHPQLADEIRYIVSQEVLKTTTKRIDLFEQVQTW